MRRNDESLFDYGYEKKIMQMRCFEWKITITKVVVERMSDFNFMFTHVLETANGVGFTVTNGGLL